VGSFVVMARICYDGLRWQWLAFGPYTYGERRCMEHKFAALCREGRVREYRMCDLFEQP
jgi:hypothetical protein